MKRLLTALLVALVAVVAVPGMAYAEVVAPDPASPRTIVSTEPFDNPGIGKCSRYGLGWVYSHRAEPGDAALLVNAGNTGTNLLANLFFFGSRFMAGAAASSADEVLGTDSWVNLLDTLDESMRSFGAWWWVLFGALALAATAVYMAWRSRLGEVGRDAGMHLRALVITGSALAIVGGTLVVGPMVNQGVRNVYDALSSTAVVGSDGQSAASAVCDAITDGLIYPAWAGAHFGHDEAAKEQYGERLLAASTLTWEEQIRVDADPAEARNLLEAKGDDYVAIAEEIKEQRPVAWKTLAGVDTMDRAGWGALAFFGALPPAAVLVFCMWTALVLMVAARLLVYVWPIIAAVVQYPPLHYVASRIVGQLARWVVFCLLSMAAYVVTTTAVIPAFVKSDMSLLAKVVAIISLVGVTRELWRRRKVIYRKARVQDTVVELQALRHVLAAKVGGSAEKAGESARKASRAVQQGIEYRDGQPIEAEKPRKPRRLSVRRREQTPVTTPAPAESTAVGPVTRRPVKLKPAPEKGLRTDTAPETARRIKQPGPNNSPVVEVDTGQSVRKPSKTERAEFKRLA